MASPNRENTSPAASHVPAAARSRYPAVVSIVQYDGLQHAYGSGRTADYAAAPARAPEAGRLPADADLDLKRAFDCVAATLGVLLLAPLLLLVAAAILIDSKGPAIFRQTRTGRDGRLFKVYKFRTMTVTEDSAAVVQAQRNDLRVTRLGRLLRKTSIDELPQLLNVVLGDMSLVGPRPHALAHDMFYSSMIPEYVQRQRVRPGITGWAQVNGSRGVTPTVAAMARRVRYDNWYIENWSFWLDLKILVRTVATELGRSRFAF